MKLRLLSAVARMYFRFPLRFFLICILIAGIGTEVSVAANKKKKKKSGDKVSIARRAYEDITTRNNYYFNANLLWKETLDKLDESRKLDYDSILPIYFFERANLKAHNNEWDEIIKKMGLVMQMHDYTRWKDDAFLLLGQAHFMKGEYAKAQQTFQYISTTMKGKFGQEKLAVTNKERLKLIQQMEKERKKKAKEKKKIIEFNLGIAQKEAETRKKESESKAQAARQAAQKKAADRQKMLREKAKLKEKYLSLKQRGRSVPPTFTEYYEKNSKYAKKEDIQAVAEEEKKSAGKEEKTSPAPPPDYSKIRLIARDTGTTKLSALDRTEEEPLADSLKRKELDKASDLTFWEKIKHKPGRPDAIVWMAITLMQRNDDETAHALIQYGQSLRKLTRKNKRDLQLVEAHYFIRRNNYQMAQQPLVNAIDLTKKKGEKAQYAYILAQLQEQTGQYDAALDNYRLAGKFSRNMELSFYSRLSQARLYGKQGLQASEEDLIAKLKKMVRGGKNKTFADQVYYSIAQLSLEKGDTTAAIDNLLKSASFSTGQPRQKGMSFAMLSAIAIEQDRYVDAKAFADSSIAYLPPGYSGLDSIKKAQFILANAAQFETAIHEQDSLLVLAAMTDAELAAWLFAQEQQIEKEEKKSKRRKNWTEGESSATGSLPQLAAPISAASSGAWYFYNNDLRARGYNEFVRIWGDRGLEDGWRRSDKSIFSDLPGLVSKKDVVAGPGESLTFGPAQDKTEAVTEGIGTFVIPRSPVAIAETRETLAQSLYGLGFELRAGLRRPDKALPYFLRLLSEFSESALEPKALYNAWMSANELEMYSLAAELKDKINAAYAGTEYAQEVTKPRDIVLTRDKPRRTPNSEEVYYASTYDLFTQGEYTQVITRQQYALENYKGGKYIPQFEFLGALSLGHLDQLPELKNALAQIILKYPNTEVQKKAQEYLRYLSQDPTQTAAITTLEEKPAIEAGIIPQAPKTPYDTGDNNLYFMAYFAQKEPKLEDIKKKLAFVGDENFGKDKYKVSNAFLDNNQTVLLSKRFKNETEAKKYMEVISANKRNIFGSSSVELFIISQSNFRVFFDTKDVASYRVFHDYYFK